MRYAICDMRYAICDMRYAMHGMAVNAVMPYPLNVNIQKLKRVPHVPRITFVPRGTNYKVYLNCCYIFIYLYTIINKYIFISLLFS